MKLAARISVTQHSIETGSKPKVSEDDVGHLVPDHHDALGQVLRAAVGGVRAEHVHPRLLEVVDVGDVVDVAEQVEVGPPQRAA